MIQHYLSDAVGSVIPDDIIPIPFVMGGDTTVGEQAYKVADHTRSRPPIERVSLPLCPQERLSDLQIAHFTACLRYTLDTSFPTDLLAEALRCAKLAVHCCGANSMLLLVLPCRFPRLDLDVAFFQT